MAETRTEILNEARRINMGHCLCEGIDPTTSVYAMCKGLMKQYSLPFKTVCLVERSRQEKELENS